MFDGGDFPIVGIDLVVKQCGLIVIRSLKIMEKSLIEKTDAIENFCFGYCILSMNAIENFLFELNVLDANAIENFTFHLF